MGLNSCRNNRVCLCFCCGYLYPLRQAYVNTESKRDRKVSFFNAESDAEGVSFEIINAREVGSDCVLDLRWVNRSGKTIEYGASYELFRREKGKWVKIEPEPVLIFPSIGYSINSGFTAELSYTIPSQYKLSPDERYRFQAAFQFRRGSELSGKMINSLEFEAVGEVDSNGIYRCED